MVSSDEITILIASRREWLLVRENGRVFPLLSEEIDITQNGSKTLFSFPNETGYNTWRLNGWNEQGTEIIVDVAGAFGRDQQLLRLIPRTQAAETSAAVEAARLEKANEIAEILNNSPAVTIESVRLNVPGGRIAQVIFRDHHLRIAAAYDVTGELTHEALMGSAMVWFEKTLAHRKKPVALVHVISEGRRAHLLQKLHALLSPRWRQIISVNKVTRKTEPPEVNELPKLNISGLWREKARALVLPKETRPSESAAATISKAPEAIDIVFSRNGETLRFNGMPFARIRRVSGEEKVWFGTGRRMQLLDERNREQFDEEVEQLRLYRTASSPNKRHAYYQASPEAWLESILRRDIKLLDGNLIPAPIYNQFRSSNDKIDLLALRNDGRLVVVEVKAKPDRDAILQVVDYWRKIELQRRRGVLAEADLFDGRDIADKPAVIYLAAPALGFHSDTEFFMRSVAPEIEIWRFELHQKWREKIRVIGRRSQSEPSAKTNL
ncbi:MAG: hypothetical protein IPM50_08040 [Acidobacteriota bacterium]|nr:MAG: hypothetical protein IPM50_08040 [Acidobacteriota bacterium]